MMMISQADVNARTPAYLNYLKGMKSKVTGKQLYHLLPNVRLSKD